MKEPKFFYSERPSCLAKLLKPLSLLYRLLYKIDHSRKQKDVIIAEKTKVIAVGGLVIGGSGKTPTAIMLANIIKETGKTYCFLSSGYKGKFDDFIRVTMDMDWKVCGDEAKMLSRYGDCYVFKNKKHLAKNIETIEKYDYVIVDDAFQKHYLKSDVNILVVDGDRGFGNKALLPAGPMRSKIKDFKDKIDFVVNTSEGQKDMNLLSDNKIIQVVKAIHYDNISSNNNLVVFSGIANNGKFHQSLQEISAKIINSFEFPDHHSYTEKDITRIYVAAKNSGIVTTEKDYVKIPPKYQKRISVLKLTLKLSQEDKEFIKNRIVN